MTLHRSPLTGRTKVDLRGSLPPWLTLLLGLAIAAGVAVVAWMVGQDEPVPEWIREGLVPALGWIYLGLVVIALVGWWRRRRSGASPTPPSEET